MEYKFNPLEPNLVGPVKVRALASGDSGKGWRSPCPQLHIDIGKNATGAAIIGYENIALLKAMCEHALSKDPWDDSSPKVKVEKKPDPCLHIYNYTKTHMTCQKCGIVGGIGKWPDFKYKADPCTVDRQHDWKKINTYFAKCKGCKTIGVEIKYYNWLIFEPVRKTKKAKLRAKTIANIIINDLMKHCNEKACKVNELGLSSYDVWWLSELIFHEVLDRSKISKVIDHFIKFGGEVKEIIGSLNLWPTYDDRALEEAIDKMISDNPKAVKEILAGKMKIYGFLIGRLKQADKNIDSKEAMKLLKEKING